MTSSRVWMRSSRVWMRSSWVWMGSSRVCMRSSRAWMRSSRVVRAAGCQCQSRNSHGLDLSILRHSGIWGVADEAALNNINKKIQKSSFNFLTKVLFSYRTYFFVHIVLSLVRYPVPVRYVYTVCLLVLLVCRFAAAEKNAQKYT